MKKNVASQSISAQMTTAADGTVFTGAVSVLVTLDNGTQTAGTGTAPTHKGNGLHTYVPSQAETNADHIAFTFTGTGAITATIQLYTTYPQTADNDTKISLIPTTPMRGTDSALLASGYTAPDNVGIADIPTVAEFNARTLLAADYFDPALDTVANVTLVATTTTNTDMRGTDNANTVAPDNTSISAILVDTNELQTDDIPTLIAALPTAAEINAEVVNIIEVDTHPEPTATIGATATIRDAIMWNKTVTRNKITQTATTTLLRNDADTLNISTSTVSDDGTTFTRGKHA